MMNYKAKVSSQIVQLQILLEEACKDTSRDDEINRLMDEVFNEFVSLPVSDIETNNPENK